jgi:DNA-binding transcriptional regulator YdaS (Cro superfamily)
VRHPLARAVASAGIDSAEVAARLGVDPKTVERWYAGRVPYPRHRAALAELTGWNVRELWPSTTRPVAPQSALDEVRVAYPHRSAVPVDAWHRLFSGAKREIGILVYSGLFLAEDAMTTRLLRAKASEGVRVRIALGDIDGTQIASRGADEGIDDVMAARIRNALILYRPLTEERGVELRLHDTVLYNSIYFADDDLLVNAHVYGCPAPRAPVLHLRRTRDGGMAATYLDSFERVWEAARPAD